MAIAPVPPASGSAGVIDAPKAVSSGVRFGRSASVGAIIGAILMLLALPASRNLIVGPFFGLQFERDFGKLSGLVQGTPLMAPTSQMGRALWLRLAARKIALQKPMSRGEVDTVRALAREGAAAEPDNGFWTQMLASLDLRAGDKALASTDWLKSSKALRYDDHEDELFDSIATVSQTTPSYAYAQLYELRDSYSAQLISTTGQALAKADWFAPQTGIQTRLATLLNGDLLRKHARSLSTMNLAIGLEDASVDRILDEPTAGRHQHLVARLAFENAVQKASLGYSAKQVDDMFLERDSAVALTSSEDPKLEGTAAVIRSSVIGTLPGAFLAASLLAIPCLLVLAGYRAILRLDGKRPWFGTMAGAIFILLGGMLVMPSFAALTCALCMVFASSSPKNIRSKLPAYLGPLSGVMTQAASFLIVLVGVAIAVLLSTPGSRLVESKIPVGFDWLATAFGIWGLILGGLFLSGPLWAFAQRIPSGYVITSMLKQATIYVVAIATVGAILAAPICIYLDRRVQPVIHQLYANEPLYYLLR